MRKFMVLVLLLFPISLARCAHAQQTKQQKTPAAFSQAMQQGFDAGVTAARRDMRGHRQPDARRHPEYRMPPVGLLSYNDYRNGFMAGYQHEQQNPSAPAKKNKHHKHRKNDSGDNGGDN